jgi:hypothetical protein
MIGLLCFALAVLGSPFSSKLRLQAENAVLRHQLNVVRRKLPGRVRLTNNDRWFFIQLYRWFPAVLKVLTIIRPETLVRWHRAGFRCYWRWKSRPLGGRPQIDTELRVLIRRMSVENPLWGAPSRQQALWVHRRKKPGASRRNTRLRHGEFVTDFASERARLCELESERPMGCDRRPGRVGYSRALDDRRSQSRSGLPSVMAG